MEHIYTSSGEISYSPIDFIRGQKTLNRDICRENLIDACRVFDMHGIHYGLWFGTLLGAVREGDFIEYDEDVDLFTLIEYRQDTFDCLHDLYELGFTVARYKYESLLSIIRDDDYIDIYFYERRGDNRIWRGNYIEARYIEELEIISFVGEMFPVPKNPEKVLRLLYGDQWKVPIRDAKPRNLTFKRRVEKTIEEAKLSLIKRYPGLHKNYRAVKCRFI